MSHVPSCSSSCCVCSPLPWHHATPMLHPQEAAIEAQQEEVALHQRILREEAELTRAANAREDSLRSLAVHRQRAQEDRHRLAEEKRVSEPCPYGLIKLVKPVFRPHSVLPVVA